MLKEILTLLREEKSTLINKVKEVQEESNHEMIAEYKARLYNHPSKVISENTIVGFILSLPNICQQASHYTKGACIVGKIFTPIFKFFCRRVVKILILELGPL